METTTLNITEIKKELIKNRSVAQFTHYIAGNLYYKVTLESGTYQFPIPSIEEGPTLIEKIVEEDEVIEKEVETIQLSTDLGTTPFDSEIKASFLNRWIQKAVKNDEFIRI